MPPQLILVCLVTIGLPIARLVSEFQPRRWLRIVLGLLSLSVCLLVAITTTTLYHTFNYNAWYGTASAKLLETIIAEMESGHTERLLPALKDLRSNFYPTYENRANYDGLVDQFAVRIETEVGGDQSE